MAQGEVGLKSELVGLVISMVKQLVRREVRLDPSQIIGVVREALSILPVGSRSIRVILHPEDAKLIREVYDMSDNEQSWKVTEDPVLARGGCRVRGLWPLARFGPLGNRC